MEVGGNIAPHLFFAGNNTPAGLVQFAYDLLQFLRHRVEGLAETTHFPPMQARHARGQVSVGEPFSRPHEVGYWPHEVAHEEERDRNGDDGQDERFKNPVPRQLVNVAFDAAGVETELHRADILEPGRRRRD